MFDFNDVSKKPKIEPIGVAIEEHNIGAEQEPKMIKPSKYLPSTGKLKYIELFKEFIDNFAWSYEDLKSYDTGIIQHKIPLKEDHKTFKHKLRRINPILMHIIEKEVKRMYDAKVIVPLRYSKWVSNLVPTRKKPSEIRLCIDLWSLNKASLKDNYPLPKMDHILQKVVGSSRISILDDFSSYNHVLVHHEDQKTTFTTRWSTFMYMKMPFGLMNVVSTFEREMEFTFVNEMGHFIVIYLDDIIVFLKIDEEHLNHLRRVFEKYRRFGISLNLQKTLFYKKENC